MCAKARPYDTQSNEQQTLLGIFSDNKLTFDKHINYLCARASQKRNALCRVLLFLSTKKKAASYDSLIYKLSVSLLSIDIDESLQNIK